MMSRTIEWTPSAPITASAEASVPSAKDSVTAAAGLVEADELLAEMNDLGGQHRQQRIVQIAAMHAQIGRAVEAFRHRQFARDFAGVPHAIEMRVAARTMSGATAASMPMPRSTFIELGIIWMPAPMRAKLLRLFVDLHVDAGRRSVAAAASPPMPAPTMAMESFFRPMRELHR